MDEMRLQASTEKLTYGEAWAFERIEAKPQMRIETNVSQVAMATYGRFGYFSSNPDRLKAVICDANGFSE